MTDKYYFPFGQELKKVEQKDKSPKKAFVLGVYASAVHAKWTDKDGRQKVAALAVASEPEIFWTGNNAEQIISAIKFPEQLGKLSEPSDKKLNGPSGRALDKLFLSPLGLDRNKAWLCDLLPESRVNEKQRQAINNNYTADLIKSFNLKPANILDFDKAELNSQKRREEILNELEISQAETLILLGDLPIYWFLRFNCVAFFCPPYRKEEVIDLYNNHKDTLIYLIRESHWPILYTKVGIVSMAKFPLDMRMWSYYSRHSGFQVIFDTKEMPNYFKGPFPINYRSNFDSIDFVKYGSELSLIYQTNVKSNDWQHEKEWRYLVFDKNLTSPIDIETQKNPKERKFKYPKAAIKEIILGFKFFDVKNMPDKNSYTTFKYNPDDPLNKNVILVLDFICNNPELNVSYLNIKTNRYRFAKIPIIVTKTDVNTYEIKNHVA